MILFSKKAIKIIWEQQVRNQNKEYRLINFPEYFKIAILQLLKQQAKQFSRQIQIYQF